MKLHVLTACSRTENLGIVQESIEKASIPECEVKFHVLFDDKLEHVGGQFLKNQMLDEISDGYVYVLDDDTVMHPDLISRAWLTWWWNPDFPALAFNQDRGSYIVEAAQWSMIPNGVDIGQVILKREIIGDKRIPLTYEGDSIFLSELLKDRDDVIYLNEVLSYYNALRPEVEAS